MIEVQFDDADGIGEQIGRNDADSEAAGLIAAFYCMGISKS